MSNLRKRRPPLEDGDSIGIPLADGKSYAWIDKEDFTEVNKYPWRRRGGYAVTTGTTPQHVRMHRLILGLPTPRGNSSRVDHIDTDGLNNRRSNLRLATNSQNCRNGNRRVNAKSRFKGLVPNLGRLRPWTAQINLNGKSTHLGSFTTEEEAAMCYNVAARRHFGEFARLNQVDMG